MFHSPIFLLLFLISVLVHKLKAQAGSREAGDSLPETTPGSGRLLTAQPCRWPMKVTAASSLPGCGMAYPTHKAKAIVRNLLKKDMMRKT